MCGSDSLPYLCGTGVRSNHGACDLLRCSVGGSTGYGHGFSCPSNATLGPNPEWSALRPNPERPPHSALEPNRAPHPKLPEWSPHSTFHSTFGRTQLPGVFRPSDPLEPPPRWRTSREKKQQYLKVNSWTTEHVRERLTTRKPDV